MPSIVSPRKELFDLTYQNNDQHLSTIIQVDQAFLYATLYDETKHQYVAIKDFHLGNDKNWEASLSKLTELMPLLDVKGNKPAKVLLTDSTYTLVPSVLFDETRLRSYLSFNHLIADLDKYEFYYDKLLNHEIVIVYAIPQKIASLFKAKFQNMVFYHYSLPLLEAFLLEKNEHSKIGLHIQQQHFDLIYEKAGQLQYFNSFKYETAEDVLYYLLYAMEQLKIDREKVKLLLFGEFEKNSTLYNMIIRYVGEVEIIAKPGQVNYSKILNDLPEHHYHTLFNQYLCE